MNIVITGTSRGIGLELTKVALQRGDSVLAIARKPAESSGLTELQKKFAKTLQILAVDLSASGASEKIEDSLSSWKHIDLLINNAGIFCKGEKIEDFLSSYHVNSIMPFLITKALLPKLKKATAPKAVQITSLMGSIEDNVSGGSYAYRASKAALNMLNKCLSKENNWLTTAVIHPGWVKTEMGGSGAPVETEQSVAGIWKVIGELKPAESGCFKDFRGKDLPW